MLHDIREEAPGLVAQACRDEDADSSGYFEGLSRWAFPNKGAEEGEWGENHNLRPVSTQERHHANIVAARVECKLVEDDTGRRCMASDSGSVLRWRSSKQPVIDDNETSLVAKPMLPAW